MYYRHTVTQPDVTPHELRPSIPTYVRQRWQRRDAVSNRYDTNATCVERLTRTLPHFLCFYETGHTNGELTYINRYNKLWISRY